MQSRFDFLEDQFPKLAGYGKKAEELLHYDNNLSLLNLGRIGETVNTILSQRVHVPANELLERGIIDSDILNKIDALTEIRTEAAEGEYDSETSALRLLTTAQELCEWLTENYTESRFAFLEDIFPSGANVPPLAELSEFGQEAEENLYSNTRYCFICLGDIGESIAYMLLNMKNIPNEKDQIDRIKMLVNRGIISKQTGNTLHALRMARNLAIHSRFSLETDGRKLLEDSLELCEWLFRFTMSAGDIVRGRIRSIDGESLSVSIGRMSATVPPEEIPDIEAYRVGEKCMFRVRDTDGESISLSLRDINSDPWSITSRRYEKYTVGQEVNAVIKRLTKTLGAVVELRDGLEARIPDQELGSNIYNRKKGIKYEVKARVKWFDPEHYPYMLLSVKDMEEGEQETPEEEAAAMPDSYFMEFCKNASAEDIRQEIARGANVNAKNKKGMSALMVAAVYNRSPEVIGALIDGGANVNAKNYKANTALIFAAMYSIPEVVKEFVEKGAEVDAVNADNRKALHYARSNKKLRNDSKTIELLGGLAATPPAYAKTVRDKQFLELCQSGTEQEILDVLNDGVNVNVASRTGRTSALMFAAKFKGADVVRALIEHGAEVNAQNKKGDTALILASRYNTGDVVTALLDAGADREIMNAKGENALYWAEGNPGLRGNDALGRLGRVTPEPDTEETDRMMKMILQRDFLSMCKAGSVEEVDEALKAGVDVNRPNTAHVTALMFAARFNSPEVVNLLLDAGADVLARNDKGRSALDYARKNDKLDGTEALRRLEE